MEVKNKMGHELMVPGEGLEPSLCCQNRILNPARLPIPPPRPGEGPLVYRRDSWVQGFLQEIIRLLSVQA